MIGRALLMAPRGRPPSAKTLVDRQLGRNIVHPVLPAGDSYIIPNHSGQLDAGTFALTDGSIIFSKGQKLTEDNFNLFWNDATNELQPNLLKIVSDGSQASPSLKFNDTNTGFYKSGDSVSFSLNNSTIMTMDATGVGIGVAAHDGTLHVHTGSAGDVTADSSSDDLVVENSGNAGISILTPPNTEGAFVFGRPADPVAGKILYRHFDDEMRFFTNNIQRFTLVNGNGEFANDLFVVGNLTWGTLDSSDITGAELETLTDDSMADTLHRHSELSASDGTPDRALIVNATGNVGIGIATPDGKLHVHTATSGGVTAGAPYDDLIVENNGDGGISVLTPAGTEGSLVFGRPGKSVAGHILYDHSSDTMNFLTFNAKVMALVGNNAVLSKAAGRGIKVDFATPTFGFADIIGDQFSKNTGPTKPTLATYNGVINAWQFGDGDEAYMSFHIPHDYVPGTDIHLHIHWSQTSATATGGTLDFKYTGIYAKSHNQASGSTFTSTPITATFSTIDINDGGGGLNQYQQFLTEVTISAATATAALFDRDDFEPDGVIELTFEMDANNLTNSVAVLDPFIHFVDIHYQTTGLIGTKDKAPDFYA